MGPVLMWMASGFVAGWVVRVAMGSRRDFGVLGDLTLGTLGGLVGGWLVKHAGATTPDGWLPHVLVAVTGAATLVGGLRLLRRALHVAGVTTGPALGLEADLESQLRVLSDVQRRVLARVLGRRPRAERRVQQEQLDILRRIEARLPGDGNTSRPAEAR